VLPGDGAFAATMEALRARGLDEAIRTVLGRATPFLGICVGMQLLYESSDEHGMSSGFGVFSGTIRRFAAAPRVPHMGWNELEVVAEHPFVSGLRSGDYAYFLHSYRAPAGTETLAVCEHGERFSAVVARENVMATQFHPEKSQRTGALLLDNFLRIVTAGGVACC
jgi:glutamine amidotransferase